MSVELRVRPSATHVTWDDFCGSTRGTGSGLTPQELQRNVNEQLADEANARHGARGSRRTTGDP